MKEQAHHRPNNFSWLVVDRQHPPFNEIGVMRPLYPARRLSASFACSILRLDHAPRHNQRNIVNGIEVGIHARPKFLENAGSIK
jgi:hypothetical protein